MSEGGCEEWREGVRDWRSEEWRGKRVKEGRNEEWRK